MTMFEIVRDATCSLKIFNGDISGISALCLEPDFSALGVYGIFHAFFTWASAAWWKFGRGDSCLNQKQQRQCLAIELTPPWPMRQSTWEEMVQCEKKKTKISS